MNIANAGTPTPTSCMHPESGAPNRIEKLIEASISSSGRTDTAKLAGLILEQFGDDAQQLNDAIARATSLLAQKNPLDASYLKQDLQFLHRDKTSAFSTQRSGQMSHGPVEKHFLGSASNSVTSTCLETQIGPLTSELCVNSNGTTTSTTCVEAEAGGGLGPVQAGISIKFCNTHVLEEPFSTPRRAGGSGGQMGRD